MQITYPEKPSALEAAFIAPAVTPVIAIPLVALLPDAYASPIYTLIAIPIVIVLSLIYGYVGMFLVCLPVLALLKFANRVNAIRLCLYTTILGATIWVWYSQWNQELSLEALATYFAIGAGCSLAVAASFCWLAGITIRSSGRHNGAA